MLFKDLVVAKNRHLTIYEKNKVIKLFDDKSKRMPDDLNEELSTIEVLEIEESTGLTRIVLDCGKTLEELNEEKRAIRKSAKNALNRIGLASALMMASLPFDNAYRWRMY